MTILNCTLTTDALIVSQDMGLCHPDGSPAALARKPIIRPDRRLIAAGAGNVAFTHAQADLLDNMPALDADQIATGLRTLPGAHVEQAVLVGWWSEAIGGPVAFTFRADEGFIPVPVQAGEGHVISPAEAVIEDREEALTASIAAIKGQHVERFHVLLAKAQHEAARRSLIGKLTLVRLDREGVTVRDLDIFPHQPQGKTCNSVGELLAARWALHPAAA